MNVLQIVTEPLVIHKRKWASRQTAHPCAPKPSIFSNEVGMDDSALGRHPHEFSADSGNASTSPARWRCAPSC